MIRHIVMFKIKDEFKDEIPQLVENFKGMKGRIEGMLDLEAGQDILHPIPVFLPGESQRRRSLVGCCLWGRAELDTTEAT